MGPRDVTESEPTHGCTRKFSYGLAKGAEVGWNSYLERRSSMRVARERLGSRKMVS